MATKGLQKSLEEIGNPRKIFEQLDHSIKRSAKILRKVQET